MINLKKHNVFNKVIKQKVITTIIWAFGILLITYFGLSVLRFASGRLEDLPLDQGPGYLKIWPVVLVHGLFGVSALLIGPWQFLGVVRQKFPRVHKVLGRIYMVAILIGGVTGFYMGAQAYGGVAAQFGFCLLSVLWIATAYRALVEIIRGNIILHKQWMIRNYTLTLAAITLRQLVGVLHHWMGLDYDSIYWMTVYLAWMPQLLCVEIFLQRKIILNVIRSKLKGSFHYDGFVKY